MKKHLKNFNNENGVVMVTVIILVTVLSVVAVSIIAINVSQQTTGQTVIDAIKAEQLSQGAFFYLHQLEIEGCPNPPCTTAGDCDTCELPPEFLDEKSYTTTIVKCGNCPTPGDCDSCPPGTNPNDVDSVQITIDF